MKALTREQVSKLVCQTLLPLDIEAIRVPR